jgi:hypothetical protein
MHIILDKIQYIEWKVPIKVNEKVNKIKIPNKK